MSTGSHALTLVVALGALGLAGYALATKPGVPTDLDARLADLEDQVGRLARAAERRETDPPSLRGADWLPPSRAANPPDTAADSGPAFDDAMTRAAGAEGAETLKAIVDEAVEKKAREVADEMRLKANKKPPVEAFAKTLGLTPAQVAALEDHVRRGQFALHEILRTPTDDGADLMEELVEVVAKSVVQPDGGVAWGRWIGRVMSEVVPGTDESYGARIEQVKERMRETFEREWTPEQYAEFEAWGVDPTEIQDVPGSPNEALEARIRERVRELGGTLPDEK